MWELNRFKDLQAVTISTSEARRIPLADTIDRENGCILKTRVVETACCVSLMVAHVVDWTIVAKHFPDLTFRPARIEACQHFLLRRKTGQHHPYLSREFFCRLLVVGDTIDLIDRNSAFFETVVERALRNARIVFATRKALLLHSRNEHAVFKQAARCVVKETGNPYDVSGHVLTPFGSLPQRGTKNRNIDRLTCYLCACL